MSIELREEGEAIMASRLDSVLAKLQEQNTVQKGRVVEPIPRSAEDMFWDLERDGLTQSIIGLITLCPAKGFIKLIEGLESGNTSDALILGDMFHRVLDSVYSAMVKDPSQDTTVLAGMAIDTVVDEDLQKMFDEGKPQFLIDQMNTNASLARVMSKAYFQKWHTDITSMNWVDLERVFEVPFEYEISSTQKIQVPLRGKYDGVFRDKRGRLWLFETKTKSQVDEGTLVDKLSFDIQVMIYLWTMYKIYGEWPQGVVYNVVRKPQLRQKASETDEAFHQRILLDMNDRPDFYFIRYHVSIEKDELQTWINDELNSLVGYALGFSKGFINFRNTNACQMWNRPCEFLKVCAHGDRHGLVRRKELFPELKIIQLPDGQDISDLSLPS